MSLDRTDPSGQDGRYPEIALPGIIQTLLFLTFPNFLWALSANSKGISVGTFIGNRRLIFITDPLLANTVLRKCQKSANLGLEQLLGDDSLFVLNGEQHTQHRKVLSRAVAELRQSTNTCVPLAVADSVAQTGQWHNSRRLFLEITMRTLSYQLFGRDMVQQHPALLTSTRSLLKEKIAPLLISNRNTWYLRRARNRLEELVTAIDDDLELLLGSRGVDSSCLSVLRDSGFDSEEIRSEIKSLYAGAVETVSHLVGWNLFRVRSRLRSDETKNRNEIARACARTLQFHSPVQSIERIATHDVELGGGLKPVRAGSRISINIHEVHRRARADANSATPVGGGENGQQRVSLSFGGGQHKCIGNRLGVEVANKIVETLLSDYEAKIQRLGFFESQRGGTLAPPFYLIKLDKQL